MVYPSPDNYTDISDNTYNLNGTVNIVFEDMSKEHLAYLKKQRTFLLKEIKKIEHYIEIACSVEGFWSGRKLKFLFSEKEKLLNKLDRLI